MVKQPAHLDDPVKALLEDSDEAALGRLARTVLGQLPSVDRDRRSFFFGTFRAVREARLLLDAAEALGIGERALRDRLKRFSSLTGLSPTEPRERYALDLGWEALLVLRAPLD